MTHAPAANGGGVPAGAFCPTRNYGDFQDSRENPWSEWVDARTPIISIYLLQAIPVDPFGLGPGGQRSRFIYAIRRYRTVAKNAITATQMARLSHVYFRPQTLASS